MQPPTVDNDQTLYDDLLTPVIEEQERSCEDTSFERLKSLKEECEDVSESTMQGNGNGSGATTDLLLDDDKTPVNPLDEGSLYWGLVHDGVLSWVFTCVKYFRFIVMYGYLFLNKSDKDFCT